MDFSKPGGQVPVIPSCLGIIFASRQAWNQLLKQNRSLEVGGSGWHVVIIDPGSSCISVFFLSTWFASSKVLHGPEWLLELHSFCRDGVPNFVYLIPWHFISFGRKSKVLSSLLKTLCNLLHKLLSKIIAHFWTSGTLRIHFFPCLAHYLQNIPSDCPRPSVSTTTASQAH